MDELLMTPPIANATLRGLLPRRTLEPLMEEDSDTYSTTSTEKTPSPNQVTRIINNIKNRQKLLFYNVLKMWAGQQNWHCC